MLYDENRNPFPENQKEYCSLCIDRMEECCPCDSYNNLPDDEKFDLEDL